MRLKAFRTYGFKSFAEKTELSFDQGITAIVGPNGSGKSNIADAIRWVMGEQSAKYLRGSKMEDVIFSGSAQRRGLGLAEVSLCLDNGDHGLPLDFEEVLLTRRLYRSGESEYAINKKPCRLKDIVDLLADTGLGKGSLSNIGQNHISEILDSRPEERRGLFEEAAGIAKFRLRKKEALRRLDSTAANLTRINDIKGEVERQVGPLREAAAKTNTYNELTAKLRGLRLTTLLRRIDRIQAQRARLAQQRQELENQLAAASAALAEKEAAALAAKQSLADLTANLDQLQSQALAKEREIEANKGQLDVLAERQQQCAAQLQRLQAAAAKNAAHQAQLEQQRQEAEASYKKAEEESRQAAQQVGQLTAAREEAGAQLAAARQEEEELRSAFFADMQELLAQRNQLTALEREQEQCRRQREALKLDIDKGQEESQQQEAAYSKLLEEQSQCRLAGQQALKEYNGYKGELEQLQGRLADYRRQQQAAQGRFTAASTREQTLRRLQEAYEGFGYGSRNILKAAAPWRQQVLGAVAQLVHTQAAYVTAIETALGEGAQNLVTRDTATAKAAIAYLKSSGGGRATLLPLDILTPRQRRLEEEQLLKLPGVVGFAADLVSQPREVAAAVSFLLGRVLIAENLDAALTAAKAGRYRLRVVTLEGDTVNPGGSLSGGSKKQREGYLSRALEIEGAAQEAAALSKEVLSWQEQLEAGEEQAAALNRKGSEAAALVNQLSLRYKEQEQTLKRLEQDKEAVNERLSELLDRRSELAQTYLAQRGQLKELKAALSGLEARDEASKEAIEALKRRLQSLGSQVTVVENQLADAQAAASASSEKSKYLGQRLQDLVGSLAELDKGRQQDEQEGARLEQVIADCEVEAENIRLNSSVLLADIKQLLAGKEEFSQQCREQDAALGQAEAAATDGRKEVAQVEARLQKLAVDGALQEADYQHALEELAKDYQLSEAEARLEDLSAWAQEGDRALSKAESQVEVAIADLGPINPAAPAEYAAVQERWNFLNQQYADLTAAKEELEGIISKIDRGMKQRFNTAFAAINDYFASTYSKLFGGGTAFLSLTEPEDSLNSGIEIQAQPPGKKLQSLSPLSGGERALTVIALLFALLSYRPAPFCILDEIDAALDDANIGRFASFLRDYAAGTQFIVITHRKGTMEKADIMYGITMEESGVSKILSVKINEKE